MGDDLEIASRLRNLASAWGGLPLLLKAADRLEALASRPAVAEGWVLVDVGCLECGEESAAVALFADQTEGEAAADRLNASDLTFTGGQHEFQLMSLPSAIAEPYAALLSAAPKP